ncbi:MAG: hypothetical protein GKR89_03465 [Candidatus Latescibacteria bacterium]|nr:hypothetical protein [Candidatus Latescibacterota bacterium]
MPDCKPDLDQLDDQGYTIVPGFMDRGLTSRARQHVDSLLPPIALPEQQVERRIHTLRHPIPGPIMADLITQTALHETAVQILHGDQLRLLEQVLMRSDPRPPPHGPLGWHVDFAFLPEHYQAQPRQVYFQMITSLNTVEPGCAPFMIVPGSHHLTYAASQRLGSLDALEPLKKDPAGVAGIDIDKGIEIRPHEGDLLIFNPMCLHSGSDNATDQPRYVYFASFFPWTATYLQEQLWRTYRGTPMLEDFSDDLRNGLPPQQRYLLDW